MDPVHTVHFQLVTLPICRRTSLSRIQRNLPVRVVQFSIASISSLIASINQFFTQISFANSYNEVLCRKVWLAVCRKLGYGNIYFRFGPFFDKRSKL